MKEAGYGTLLRTVAASIENEDPDAAQALNRAADDIEQMLAELRQVKLERDDFEQRLHAYKSGEHYFCGSNYCDDPACVGHHSELL